MSLPWTERIRFGLHNMQRKLAFHGWEAYPQYSHSNGIGRSALISTFLGILWGIHALLGLQCVLALAMIDTSSGSTSTSTSTTISPLGLLAPDRLQLLLQWSLYVVALTTFHLAEFFVTSLHNPTVATSDSFLVNHSVHYTLAALSSWTEFWVRYVCVPSANSKLVFAFGIALALLSQAVRWTAMATCGTSFNHLIQREKKESHLLITHGIYRYLRHPSYVGFYYWSIATQLVLCNPVNALLYAGASTAFFRMRIPYEERHLLALFPNGEYATYAKQTWIGIPLVHTQQDVVRT